MPTGIEIRRRGPAAVLALTGLDARGMFNTRILQELKQAIEELPEDESVRVIVITGVGDQFCTGGNFGNEPEIRTKLNGAGLRVMGGTRAALLEYHEQDSKRWHELAKATGILPE